MDVCGNDFYQLLPAILNDVGQSLFVALDLELSGVPLKQSRVPGQSSRRQTLQQRYQQTKEAAEKYQILQIGLTFVQQDEETGLYICRPYNIPISPLVQDGGLQIEREITFSSSAASFLRSVSFDFDKPFHEGVPYLNGREQSLERERYSRHRIKARSAKLDINKSDAQALAFVEDARHKITHWLASKDAEKDSYLNIGPPAFQRPGEDSSAHPEMTKYQKWLVHHLVEVEFPQLKAFGKRGFIRIVLLNVDEEKIMIEKQQAEFEYRLARQQGFGWLILALLGQPLPVDTLARLVHEATSTNEDPTQQQSFARQLRDTSNGLPQHQSILVGHNCFLDFVYLYHTFIGVLPETVEEFVEALHQSFPFVIDTKYMATHNCGDIPPNSSLEDLVRWLQPKDEEQQIDEVDPAFDKYAEMTAYHEAGYDSLMTAQVAIRLSRQLEAAGTYVDDIEYGGVSLSSDSKSNVVSKVVDKSVGAITNTLASLGLQTRKTQSASTSSAADGTARNASEGGMPSFASDFWRVYGNKLRIFGTEETVLDLEPHTSEEES